LLSGAHAPANYTARIISTSPCFQSKLTYDSPFMRVRKLGELVPGLAVVQKDFGIRAGGEEVIPGWGELDVLDELGVRFDGL
jgi:hypothetical protein